MNLLRSEIKCRGQKYCENKFCEMRNELLRSEIKCRGQKYCENKLCEMRNEFAEIRNKMQRSEIL